MKNKKLNAELVWKQLEDLIVPRLRLSVIERTVYSHLLRHSRLEGKLRLRFSLMWLARSIRLSTGPVRRAVRRLVAHGVLRLVQRNKTGHVAEVRLPAEIRAVRLNRIESRAVAEKARPGARAAVNIEQVDFLHSIPLRKARPRAQPLLLLFAPHHADGAVPGPRRAAGALWAQRLPQPGLQLHGVRLAERGKAGGRFSPPPLPRPALDCRRTRRPPPRPRRPRLRQAPPSSAVFRVVAGLQTRDFSSVALGSHARSGKSESRRPSREPFS